MPRFLVFVFMLLLVGLRGPASAAPADGIPPRPTPFTFVTDQAKLLSPTDAKKLDNGLRKYADDNGTQVIVVTVPSLNGTDVADYARQLGTAWGVGQRGKDNGVVVLISGKEHKMSIQAGSGLQSAITPEVTNRVMNQQFAPAFKQGNYFVGLRKGLSTLMAAANPGSAPSKTPATASTDAAGTSSTGTGAATSTTGSNLSDASSAPLSSSADPVTPAAEPASSGFGMGSLLIGALVIGGGIWLVSKFFRRNNNAAASNQAPNFTGNRPGNQAPNFMGNQTQGGYQQGPGNYGGQAPGSGMGSGMGGILATGAAAAAGAYLGNRMAGSHDSDASAPHNLDAGTAAGLGGAGLGGAVPPANAGSDYFNSRGGDANDNAGPDYFSDENTADSSGDYFSDNSSYDDTSSDDTGGGGFDSTDDNSGSW